MTLQELSAEYQMEASALLLRVRELRRALKTCPYSQRSELERRLKQNAAIYRETRELAQLLLHYYERGYYRDERYTL